jgi:hypothetical protein
MSSTVGHRWGARTLQGARARAQCGDKRADVGLCVKHAGRGLCVPDYVRPAAGDSGWTYSQALAGVVEQYKARASRTEGRAPQGRA